MFKLGVWRLGIATGALACDWRRSVVQSDVSWRLELKQATVNHLCTLQSSRAFRQRVVCVA